jgi:predicted  nucleic acid-binding Zn-ribbon protein
LNEEKKNVEAEKNAARQRTAADQSQLRELLDARQKVVAELNPQLHRNYERLRKSRKGIAVAEAIEGRCSACHLSMRLQFFQDLRRGDQVMYCESCGRILYYNPPVETDEIGPAAAPEPAREEHIAEA